MRSNPVAVMHQILADVSLSVLAGHVASVRYPLCFQAAKHPFLRRIIPAVFSAIHALAHAVTPQPLAKVAAAILRSLIRVKQYPLRLATLLVSHLQRFDHEVCIRLCGSRAAHHSASGKLQHNRQVVPFPLCPDVGDVATPDLVGRFDIELSVQDIRDIRPLDCRLFIGVWSRLFADQFQFTHQPAHLETSNFLTLLLHH